MNQMAFLSDIPESTAKEWVSLAYMQGIIAQAGLNMSSPRWDDGIDLRVEATKPVAAGVPSDLSISFQLKATQNWRLRDGLIRFFLKESNWRMLTAQSLFSRYLVVYTLPHSRSRWIVHQDDSSTLSHAAYYTCVPRGMKLAEGRTGKTVDVPVTNRLTAVTLRNLFLAEAETWRGPEA